MIEEFFRIIHSSPETNSRLRLIDVDLTKTSNPDDILAEINKIGHLWVDGLYSVWNICHAPIDYSPEYPKEDILHLIMNDDEINDLRWTIEYVNEFINSKEYRSFKLNEELPA